MKRRRLLPLLAILVTSCSAASGAGHDLIDLDLDGSPPGAVLEGKPSQSIPLAVPTRVVGSDENRVVVEERFSTPAASLPGLSAVIRKVAPGPRCFIEFTFPPGSQPHAGIWRLKARMLLATERQRSNFNVTMRHKSDITFYLQIGPTGKASISQTGEAAGPLPLGTLPQVAEPFELEVVLDFDKAQSAVLVDGRALGSPGKFNHTVPVETLSIGVNGNEATRIVALHELTFSGK